MKASRILTLNYILIVIFFGISRGYSEQYGYASFEYPYVISGWSATAGDFNGDGFSDIVVGTPWEKSHTGKIHMY